jgi:hypothetical protein
MLTNERRKKRVNIYPDLGELPGTWSSKDEKEFMGKIKLFESI